MKQWSPASFTELILRQTKSDQLFEQFCVNHFSKVEGIRYVPTSYNYDLGRDGRSEWVRFEGTSYICASITSADRVIDKATRDLRRLLKHDRRPAKVRFCFAAEVTEVARDKIVGEVRSLARRTRSEVVGLTQLCSSVRNYPEVFEDTFSAELDAVRRYADVRRDAADEASGMRLALGTQLRSMGNSI